MTGQTASRLAVLGAGAWGTALAIAFSRQQPTVLWARHEAQVADMAARRENARYLPGEPFPDALALTSDLDAALEHADLILIATPIAGLRATLTAVCERRPVPPPVLWACKGFEADSGLLPHQVVAGILPPGVPYGALSGPSFAREVARGQPTAITLASDDSAFAIATAARLHCPRFRVYANDDLIGVEVGGAVKNVMAIAAGVSDGLGFGHNARAALITRGLSEITRRATALGGKPATLMGLAGLGDLLLTTTGDLSRNRQVGLKLAEGKPLEQVLLELGHVAEGVPTPREVQAKAERLGVDMPITAAVCAMLFHGKAPMQVVETLLGRAPKVENP